MNDRLRIGVLGGGGILRAHAPGFQEAQEHAKVTAVAEPNPEQAERIRDLVGSDVDIYPGYEELVADASIDAVDILLPHDLHVPATEAAARAGKHVLVEKVMARTVEECDQMIDVCEKAGVSLTVCHDRRYDAQWMALKQIVDSGVLGTILSWKLEHNQDVAPPSGHWIRSRERLGGGAIMSCLTHQIDALRWYGGEPASVTCMTKALPQRMEGEFAGTILAQMQSGALAQLSINWWTRSSSPGKNCLWYEMVHVCGDRGEAYLMNNRGVFLRLHDSTEAEWSAKYGTDIFNGFIQIETGDWKGHERCIREWIRSLRGEPAQVTTTGRECRGTVEVAEAAYRSERTGKVVHLPMDKTQQ
ncbi:Gfo/Idh/MocA family protein [Verrucomicrobiota bacterium]